MSAFKLRQRGLRRLLPTLLLAVAGAALAAPVPAGLAITGTVSLDTSNSVAAVGGATQSGSFSATSGGAVAGTSSFGNDPNAVAPASSQSASLSITGDGIGATLQMMGSGDGATTDGLFVDYLLSLVNSSATDTFEVTFLVRWSNSVAAAGTDAFTRSQLSVFDAGNVEVFFTDDTADTVNGDTSYSSAGSSFMVSLAPGASYSFTALQSQRGGAFADTSSNYNALLAAYLELESVNVVGQPPAGVPLPGTPALVGFGLALLAGSRRRR